MSLTASLRRLEPAEPAPGMARLERARSVVESRFLDAGEVLGLAVTGVGQLIAALDQLAAALGAKAVEDTVSELNAAAQTLFGLKERHEGRRGRIRDLSRIGESLGAGIEDEAYGAEGVDIRLSLPDAKVEELQRLLGDLSRGRIQATRLDD